MHGSTRAADAKRIISSGACHINGQAVSPERHVSHAAPFTRAANRWLAIRLQ
jgi:hypothetical protein